MFSVVDIVSVAVFVWLWWTETVASSDDDAMMLSSKGFHLMSVTGPRWPQTRGIFTSARPVCTYTHNKNSYAKWAVWSSGSGSGIGHINLQSYSTSSPILVCNQSYRPTQPLPSHITHNTTILWLCGLCLGQPGWASTRRYISPSSGFSGAKWR